MLIFDDFFQILHRDIRAENILITHNKTAKLANFKSSRSLNADTLRQSQILKQVRYCAPELLERAPTLNMIINVKSIVLEFYFGKFLKKKPHMKIRMIS
jgi:serine/threonine protein kinase